MTTLAALQQHMLSSPLYLGSKKLQYGWRRKDNGHIVCALDADGKRGKVAVLSVVGKVSDSQANVDGVGAWRSSFNDGVEKSKFSFLLEKPEGTIFARDWDRQLESVNRIQMGICDNSKSRHFIVADPSGSVLRFTKPIFEKKREGDKVTVQPREWSVPSGAEDAFEEACKRYHIRPLQVYNESNDLVSGDDIRDEVVGSLVEVNFTLRHYSLKDAQANPVTTYDCFTATVVSVTILQTGLPEDVCDFTTARDVRVFRKDEEDASQALLNLKNSLAPLTTVLGPGVAPQSLLESGKPPINGIQVIHKGASSGEGNGGEVVVQAEGIIPTSDGSQVDEAGYEMVHGNEGV